MELFGTAWDGYGSAEKELKAQNTFKDIIGIPLFSLWYLLLGFVFIRTHSIYEEANLLSRFFLAFVAFVPLFMHSQAIPCPRKDQAAFEVQKKMGQWIYLTRHCLTLQFWHQVFSLLCSWSPYLAATTNGLSVCIGALGAFVTIQYFALVVPAEGFKEECKQWAEKGVNFREVQHVLHVPALFIGLADLSLRSTHTLRQTLSFPVDMSFGMFYSIFYIILFFFNFKLTGRWPYLFMEHELGTDPKKWSVFILKQIMVITFIILVNWCVFYLKSMLAA